MTTREVHGNRVVVIYHGSCATVEGLMARYDSRSDAIEAAGRDGGHLHEEENANGPGVVYCECNDAACEEEA